MKFPNQVIPRASLRFTTTEWKWHTGTTRHRTCLACSLPQSS